MTTKVFELGELKVEIDASDYVLLERYERALEAIKAKMATLDPKVKPVDTLKTFAKNIADFFDDVFGEGSANKAFGSITSVDKILQGYYEALKVLKSSIAELSETWKSPVDLVN